MENKSNKNLILKLVLAVGVLLLFGAAIYTDVKNAKTKQNKDAYAQKMGSNVELNSYFQNVYNKINANWNNPVKGKKNYTSIMVQIDKKGNLLNVQTMSPSKDKSYEIAAMKAIVNSAPFDRLPKSLNEELILSINFESNDIFIDTMQKMPNTIVNINDPRQKMVICQALTSDTLEMKAYAKNIQKQIEQKWTPPMQFNSRLVANLVLTQEGKIKNITLETNSMDPRVQYAAQKVIQDCFFEKLSEISNNAQEEFRVSFLVMNNTKD